MSNKEKLVKILRDINPDINYEAETKLIDKGLFDSLEVMTIVTEIEERFHVEIDPDEITAENFNSAEMMLKLINKGQ